MQSAARHRALFLLAMSACGKVASHDGTTGSSPDAGDDADASIGAAMDADVEPSPPIDAWLDVIRDTSAEPNGSPVADADAGTPPSCDLDTPFGMPVPRR
jgi:hypothetical protein